MALCCPDWLPGWLLLQLVVVAGAVMGGWLILHLQAAPRDSGALSLLQHQSIENQGCYITVETEVHFQEYCYVFQAIT